MAAEIPIQNIYYLLCYAWNALDEAELIDAGKIDSTELVDLFAKVLLSGTRTLIRRGLDRGYLTFEEETARPRGKMDLAATMKRNLLITQRAACEFDELEHNVLHNRILKTTMQRLLNTEGLERGTVAGLRDALRFLRGVEEVPMTAGVFRRVQLHRNNRFYAFLLHVCALIHEQLLADETGTRHRFRDFLRDEGKMRALFQKFVFNFYAIELKGRGWKVSAPHIEWLMTASNAGADAFIPRMETDVCLESATRRIILDTKFSAEALNSRHGTERVKRADLFQLFAYLRNQATVPGWERAEGVLLYPAVSGRPSVRCELHGHPVQVLTVNLNQPWPGIRAELLDIVGLAPHSEADAVARALVSTAL